MNIQDIRAKYPQYSDLSDSQLLQGLHKKFYSDMPFDQFSSKIEGVKTQPTAKEQKSGFWDDVKGGLASAPINLYLGAKQMTTGLSPEEEKIVEYNREAEKKAPVSSILSNVATMAIPGGVAMKGAQAAGRGAGLLGTLGRGLVNPATMAESVAGGAAYMGAQPVLGDESRLQNAAMGAAGGSLGYGAGKVLGRTLTGAKAALVDPFTKKGTERIAGGALRRTLGDNAADVANKLRGYSPATAGVNPTTAEASGSGGMAAMQRAVNTVDPEAFATRDAENLSVMAKALRGMAGEVDIPTMKASRKAATEALYRAADDKVIPLDSAAKSLFDRPTMKAALMKARRLAADEGVDVSFDPNNPQITGKLLNYTKQAISDLEKNAKGNKQRIVGDLRRDLMSWAEKNVPEYAQATKIYAESSKPINQAQVADALYNKAIPALSEGTAPSTVRASSYAEALRNSPSLVKGATGMRQPIENVLSPEQMAIAQGIKSDMGARAAAMSRGSGYGSDTAQKLAMQNLIESAGAGKLTQPITRTAGRLPLIGGAYDMADEAIRKQLADAMLDPKLAAQLIENAPAAKRAALVKALQSIGGVSGIAAPAGLMQ